MESVVIWLKDYLLAAGMTDIEYWSSLLAEEVNEERRMKENVPV